jgi:hypothetical protein
MRIGGVKLEGGKIVNLVIDSIPSAPSFNAENAGEFTFSISDKVLRFNDGEKLVALNTTVSEDPNLKASLGSNWLNEDLTFNPVPFNDLPGISGLTGNDSLFDVVDQLANIVANVSSIKLSDIDMSNFSNANDMSVIGYLSGDLLLFDIEQILEGSTFNLTFDNLNGFDITDTTRGNMVFFDNNDNLVSKKTHYTYTNYTKSVSHSIPHNLGTQFCVIYCIDPSTSPPTLITPTGIDYITENEATVHFDTAKSLHAFAFNFEPPPITA